MRSLIKMIFTFTLSINSLLLPSTAHVNLVIFSKDRSSQLNALLRSVHKYINGVAEVTVIYHAADDDYEAGYDIVKKEFTQVRFLAQSRSNPKSDFKQLTLQAIKNTKLPYVLFAVDDIIVTDFIDCDKAICVLEKTKAYAFYFRLGKDITECYMERRHTGTPPFTQVDNDVYQWKFEQGTGDWGYPHSVDLTLFRSCEVLPVFERMPFVAPNPLEGNWSQLSPLRSTGVCYARSKMINIPMNLVQSNKGNRNAAMYSAKELNDLFLDGFQIDIDVLYQYPHKAPHVECPVSFIRR